jgi:pimeloyl-ACP methyl ester carboxylesterase
MPFLSRPCGAKIYYETKGLHGIPVLLLAPGGLRSSIAKWASHPYDPWTRLPESKFYLIGMDQRFADRSISEVRKGDGWHTFLADSLALLDHLQIERCHLLGSCIGPSYAFQLLRENPRRFGRGVMLQPIGLTHHTTEPGEWQGLNKHATWQWVGDWANERLQENKDKDMALLKELHSNMFDRDFVFSITRQDAATVQNPLLVMMGRDIFHPSETSREICRIVKNAELVEKWRDVGPEHLEVAAAKIEAFLEADDLASKP